MNKKIFLAVTAAFLLNSTMAQAEVKTFDFIYSGAKYSNNINITGFITLDTSLITTNFSTINMNNITDFGMTVTGANSRNGVFTKSAYAAIFFQSTSPLDFSRELVGQVLTDGSKFGFDNAGGGFFTPWSRINTSAPNTYSVNQLRVPDVFVELVSLSSVNPVPEADTSAMLLMGAGVMGFIARRRRNAQA